MRPESAAHPIPRDKAAIERTGVVRHRRVRQVREHHLNRTRDGHRRNEPGGDKRTRCEWGTPGSTDPTGVLPEQSRVDSDFHKPYSRKMYALPYNPGEVRFSFVLKIWRIRFDEQDFASGIGRICFRHDGQ